MRRFSILFCAAAIAAVACNKVEQEMPQVEESNLRPMTFTATTADTRTSLDANGTSVNWSSDDYISVFDVEGNHPFQASGSGRTVQFEGSAAANASVYYALYPRNDETSLSGTTVTTSLPAVQTPVAGTFDNGLNISAAKTESGPDEDKMDLHFSNVMSVAKFTIASNALGGKTIKTVKFTSTLPLAGDVCIDYEDLTATPGTNTVKEITMTKDEGFADGTYYFVVLPNDGGAITMTFESIDGYTATVSVSNLKAFRPGIIKNLGTVGGLIWTNKYSIVFGNAANSATAISGTTKASTVISSGTDYVTSQPFTVEGNVYYGDTKTCIRLGKTSAVSATLSIDLADAGKVSVKQIIVNCKQYNSTHAGTLSVNGATAQAAPAEAGDLTYSFNDVLIDKLVLAVSDVTYIYSIDVVYVVKTPVTLSFGDQNTFTIAQGESFTPPTLTTDPAGLTVTYASSNESVATVNETTGEITLVGGLGETKITATYAGDDTYSSGSAEYTLVVTRSVYTTIAQLKEDIGTTSVEFTAKLTNAVITRTYDNYHAWIQDETAGMYISCAAVSDLAQGDSYTGTITGSMKVTRNQPLINDIDVSNAEKTTGASVAPVDVTIAELTGSMASFDGKLCRIRKARAGSNLATGENKSIYIYQGEDHMDLFTRTSFAANSVVANNYYDIIGMPTQFDDKYEIIVVSTSDVTEASINWVLSSIAVKTAPTKTSYVVGEYFNPSGLVLSTVEMDSEVNTITRNGNDVTYTASTEGFSFSPSLTTALTSSNTSVTITYNGKSTTQTIEITDPSTPTMDVTPADGTTLNWDDDEYGNGNAKTITVALNDAASGYNVNYSDPDNLWTVDDDEDGTITVYPNAANASNSEDKELTLTITHKDDASLSAIINLKQTYHASSKEVTYSLSSTGWTNETKYTSLEIDDIITASVTGGGNSGKFYTTDNTWRLYANENATLCIAASGEHTIESVAVTFSKKDNGVLMNGSTSINSGAVIPVSANSITFSVGSSSGNKGKIFVTQIYVKYQ